jgi:exonuclease SbcC
MIPVQLTIKGFYSYARSETIDFEPLVNANLFGIFGSVGSGKSAILEAIMFVLFDRSTRLNKAGDDRYYNMMNLQSNEMVIDFIFKGGRNNKSKYRFYFMARRSSKEFSKVEVKDRSYYIWSKSDWQPLPKPDVLGMTYENFMQTVIIPQGKFREFIDQKPKDRTQMLKELFHLDRFDIAPQAFRMLGALKEQCKFIDGQLSQYLEISKVLLKQLEKEISSIAAEIEKNIITEKKLSADVSRMQLLEHQYNELLEVSDALSVLESEAIFFKNKQAQLNRYLKVQELFRDRVSQQQQLLLKAKSKEQELRELIGSVEVIDKEVRVAKKSWREAQGANEKKEQLNQQIAELDLTIRLKSQKEKFQGALINCEQAQQEIEKLDKDINGLEKQIELARLASLRQKEAGFALQKLSGIDIWWKDHTERQAQLDLMEKEQLALIKEINFKKNKKSKLKSQFVDIDELKNQIDTTREEIHSLKLQDDWSLHAKHLSDGKPCPLCGATRHPRPLSASGAAKKLSEARKRLTKLEQQTEELRELHRQVEILEIQINEKEEVLAGHQQKLQHTLDEIKKHLKRYPYGSKPERKPPNLDQRIVKKKNEIIEAEQEVLLLNSTLNLREKLFNQRKQRQGLLEKSAFERDKLQGKIDELTGMIKLLDIHEFLGKSEHQLQALHRKLKDDIQTTERDFQQSLDRLTRLEKQLNHQKGLLQSTEVQVNEIKTQNITLESEMMALCKKHGLKGLMEVQNILGLNLKPEQEQAELERYRADLHNMRSRQKSLRRKMGENQYDESKHQGLVAQLDDMKSSLNQLRHQLSSKQHIHQQYLTQLKKKESLTAELKKLTLRKEQVQEISNLLRGNGFINFISSVYLQNLCNAANTRFKNLTGNSLSMELNERNEFVVRDYLNEGKLRLLKTLSGGQIFQASLSLALSLAENVKKLNQADQSFFFLDEGFGSLDRASMQLVFETLKSLQKENRIVGIISHVEELQMEIDTYLEIEQHPEYGSTISRSWERE